MRLVANWRTVLRCAWSVRLLVFAAVFSGLEVALPFVDQYLPITDQVRGLVYFVVTVLALVSRFIAQPKTIGDR